MFIMPKLSSVIDNSGIWTAEVPGLVIKEIESCRGFDTKFME